MVDYVHAIYQLYTRDELAKKRKKNRLYDLLSFVHMILLPTGVKVFE